MPTSGSPPTTSQGRCRRRRGPSPLSHRRPVFTIGFCFGGSNSWHQAANGLGLAGAIGFYRHRPGVPRGSTPLVQGGRYHLSDPGARGWRRSQDPGRRLSFRPRSLGRCRAQLIYEGAPTRSSTASTSSSPRHRPTPGSMCCGSSRGTSSYHCLPVREPTGVLLSLPPFGGADRTQFGRKGVFRVTRWGTPPSPRLAPLPEALRPQGGRMKTRIGHPSGLCRGTLIASARRALIAPQSRRENLKDRR